MTNEIEFQLHRAMYIENLIKGVFPWKAAYFYYCEKIDRINVMSFAEFKESIQLESLSSTDQMVEISEPIYAALDAFYTPTLVYTKNNELIKII